MEPFEDHMRKVVSEGADLTRKVKTQTIGYMLAAFGFVAGLAWNQAIKSLIDYLFPLNGNSILAQFLYAIIVTAVLVWATIVLLKFSGKDNK
ncbi:MAG: hypothetical protein KGI60_02965 [Patescibacteria group bacterium]|nr:hypothetical protein [Patescibacteria group bacterium]